MTTRLTIRSIFAAAVLGSAGTAYPLSLGPVSGSAVVGHVLEVSALIQTDDAAQGNGSGCVSAELLYGDKSIDSGAIHVKVSPEGAGQVARITSSALVDEPVVTLLLRAGCGRQSTRRYVLLAEAPRDEPIVLGVTSSLAARNVGNVLTIAAAVAAAPARSARPPAAATTEKPQPVARATPRRPADADTRGAVPPAPGRLQLAVWEPGLERLPWLRVSSALRSTPSADAAHRAAATALWRALNAQPQDLLRTADRLRGLEGEVSSLRSLAARHRSEIVSARESLEDTQSQRFTNLALAVLLALLAGGGAAVFWHRSRRADAAASYASWNPPIEPHGDAVVGDMQEPVPAIRGMDVVAPPVRPAVLVPVVQQPAVVMRRQADPEPMLHLPLEFTTQAPHAKAAVAQDEPLPPDLKVDALHGAQQQSEFFASLGQFDEAIAVLTGYLEESSEQPVLAYLELFRIFHGLGRRAEYEELQTKFRKAFGVDVASFGEYRQECGELELYPAAVSRIAASWPSLASLALIEGMLFKRPASNRDLLSVDAYRELVWLYALCQDIVHSTGLPAGLQLLGGADLPNNHFILPWALGGEQGPPELSLDRLQDIDVAAGLSGFGVDIDLTAGAGDALQQARVDERKETNRAWDAAGAAAAAPGKGAEDFNAFDAVMESQSRKHLR